MLCCGFALQIWMAVVTQCNASDKCKQTHRHMQCATVQSRWTNTHRAFSRCRWDVSACTCRNRYVRFRFNTHSGSQHLCNCSVFTKFVHAADTFATYWIDAVPVGIRLMATTHFDSLTNRISIQAYAMRLLPGVRHYLQLHCSWFAI